jgi:23S rRNA (adenine2030-N6)-methyltransferase
MLSYLHSFHAGNRADLHKHAGLLALLAAMRKDPAPITYVETHSGRGRYDLNAAQAKKTGEFRDGVAALWRAKPPPRGMAPLAQAVVAENEDRDELRYYPGSPLLAANALRQRDRLELCELHPREAPALRQALARFRRAKIRQTDGLAWVKTAAALQNRRSLIMVDPSYERAEEYTELAEWLPEMASRLPATSFCIWLPLLPDARHQPMLDAFRQNLKTPAMLAPTVWSENSKADRGLIGSALVVVRAPDGLAGGLARVQRDLLKLLKAPEKGARVERLTG